ncbi:MAG: hypothetical protein ACOY9Y_13065 [Bacillota bacterium]
MKFNHVNLLNRERALLLDKWLLEPQSRPKILARIMELEEEISIHMEKTRNS